MLRPSTTKTRQDVRRDIKPSHLHTKNRHEKNSLLQQISSIVIPMQQQQQWSIVI
jgi:hypothetical protein